MRTPITASCRSRVLRSSWSRPANRLSAWTGSSACETCLSMAWVMTSSPTRLISASTLSTLTRIEVSASWLAPPLAAGVAGADGAAATGAGAAAAGAWVARLGGAAGRMSSSQSSSTQAKVSSILLRGTLPTRPRSHARCASSGSSWAKPGRRSKRAATCSEPRCSSSRMMRSGSLPLMNSDGAGVKPICQASGVSSTLAAAADGALAAAWPERTASRRAFTAATAAGSAAWPCSASRSRARSTSTEDSMASTAWPSRARLPARSSSSSVSSTWVRPAIASKPKVPAPPLIEWAARNTELMISASCCPDSRASRPASIASRPSRLSSKKVAWKRCRSMLMAVVVRKRGGGAAPGDQPSTFCTVATSCSGLNGLTSQPVAPAALPSDFLSAADSVVSISSGVNL